MGLPVVKAKIIPLRMDLPTIYSLRSRWVSIFNHWYPELETLLKGIDTAHERRRITYGFFSRVYLKQKPAMERALMRFNRNWPSLNNEVMLALSEVIEKEWPKKDRIIHAYISMDPVGPRYIKSRRFDIFYKFKFIGMAVTCVHELSHFLYFEKCKEVLPKADEKEFDPPYLVWKLSEMVPQIILNDKRIRKVVDFNFGSHPQFQGCVIKGRPLLAYLKDFYDNRKDFADFLRQSWKFVKAHEKEIP
ncbi:hypothetical protein M1329_01985 [Candidatus Marsarchaeota archaeon]|nr:hypothetical protein [Candidatus Marsarchaeota archaeon]